MTRYLLDTNHLSKYLDRVSSVEARVDSAWLAGDRFGICLPVLCEYRAGIRISKHHRRNLGRLQAAMSIFRLWPADAGSAQEFAELFQELRSAGAMMSQFDLLIAAIAKQHKLTLLTDDRDFDRAPGLKIEKWL